MNALPKHALISPARVAVPCSFALRETGLNDTFAVDQSEPRDVILEPYPLESDTITEFTTPDACLEANRLLSNDPAQT